MALSVEIDGNAVQILKGSVSIDLKIEERASASFTVVDTGGVADYVRGNKVEIFDSTPTLIFQGFIDTPGRARVGATGSELLHDIECMDNHYLADKRLVVKSYSGQTLEFIVEDILTDYLVAEGIAEGAIQSPGPVISEAIFNYVKVSEAYDALAELSGYIWYIDEDKKLYFLDRATNAAPWNLDSVTYRPIKGSVHLSTGNPLFRNHQYVRGGTGITAQQTEDFTADGVVTAFTVGYQISTAPTITEDAGGQTVGIKGIDTGKDYYWSKGDATVVAAVAPANGVAVQIVYYGQYPLIALATNHASVLARQALEGSSGIVEDITTEAQHDTADGMRASAKAKITQYCQDAEKFIYQTTDVGLYPGQLQEITYSPFGFAAHEMLIESIRIAGLGDIVIYEVSCVTGPVIGDWGKFFSRILVRQDNQIRIGDGQLLVVLQQVESLALVEATAYHTDAFPPDVSRWIALPPAQGAGHHVRHEALALVEATDDTENPTESYKWG